MTLRKASPPSRARNAINMPRTIAQTHTHTHTHVRHTQSRAHTLPAGASRLWQVERAPACAEHRGCERHAGLQRASTGTAQAAAIAAWQRLPTAAEPQRPESARIGEQDDPLCDRHMSTGVAETRRAWDARISCSVVRQSHLGHAEQHQHRAAQNHHSPAAAFLSLLCMRTPRKAMSA